MCHVNKYISIYLSIEDIEAQSEGADQELPAKRRRLDGVTSPARDTPYMVTKRRVRTFKKNGAIDTTYQVKFSEGWQGGKLTDLISELYNMFDDAIGSATTGLAENDLARVVIHHDSLDSPLVVPLRQISQLDASVVMSHVENVLNSHQGLALDTSFRIDIGVIQLPRGGGPYVYYIIIR